MELIDKIKNKFYSWTYNLWDSIGEDNNWHVIRENFKLKKQADILRKKLTQKGIIDDD